MLVGNAAQFDSVIELEFNKRTVNLKSIMGVLSLGVPENSPFIVKIEGIDEQSAMAAIRVVVTEINQLPTFYSAH
jgi:phosphocarrier protein